jgi:hypothetical protein
MGGFTVSYDYYTFPTPVSYFGGPAVKCLRADDFFFGSYVFPQSLQANAGRVSKN